jgi:large-conductance mechanosensitive channel
VSPGLLGFVVVAFLGLALFILIKSMNKQISKIQVPRENEPAARADAERDGEPAAEPDKKAEVDAD